jgi:hypothetical protein
MKGAYDSGKDARSRVLGVLDAMLTPRERELIGAVQGPDDRADDEWDALDVFVKGRLAGAMFTAPEVFFHKEHAQIGQAILRLCEVEAINRAHEDGTY